MENKSGRGGTLAEEADGLRACGNTRGGAVGVSGAVEPVARHLRLTLTRIKTREIILR